MEFNNAEGDPGRIYMRCASLSSLDESSQVAARHTATPTTVDPNTLHAQQLLAELAELRRDSTLCDVVLIAGGDEGPEPAHDDMVQNMEALELKGEVEPGSSAEMPHKEATASAKQCGVAAHRAVLAASSPYFRAMFTQFDERTMHTITIRNVEAHALEAIVEYIYNPDSLCINENNVQALMSAASLVGAAGVRARCSAFVRGALAADNVLGVRALADLLAAADLLAHADRYLDAHAAQVFACEEWLSASVDTVCEVLARDTLRLGARGELVALDAAVAWVQHRADRAGALGRVLGHVRLPLVAREELARRAYLPPLHTPDIQVKDLIIEALSCGLSAGAVGGAEGPVGGAGGPVGGAGGPAGGAGGPAGGAAAAAAAARRRPRARAPAAQMLLVVGGQAPKAISDVEALELGEQAGGAEWRPRAPLPSRRCRAGVALRGDKVWAVGGFNGTLRVRSVDVYDAARDAWAPGPSMRARRSTLGVCAVNGDLYAIGGFDGAVGLHTAEVLRAGACEWEALSSMRSRRSSVAVAHLAGRIYAVGGYDGASRQCLSSVEAYDIAAGAWQAAPGMAERRSGAAVAALGDRLYAVGGHDGPAVRRSAEVLAAGAAGAVGAGGEGGAWQAAPGMRRARRNAAAAVLGARLYVLGGDDAHTSLDTVEVFEECTGEWTELSVRMHVGRSYGGACVVPRAPPPAPPPPPPAPRPPHPPPPAHAHHPHPPA